MGWLKKFMDTAKFFASWSKNTSRKVGAIIVDEDNNILATGYNGQPRGCNDNIADRNERPAKHLFTEHAERNCIYAAARRGMALKDTIMILMWFPCADCARGIIQSGIKKIVCKEPDFNDSIWGKSFQAAEQMLSEAKVIIEYCDEDTD